MTLSSDLTKVHKVSLDTLKEVDRICRKYKIKYMLDAGTLIGAVRHKGFIPWDDDADLVMTRPNFEAFYKVASRELPEGMTLLMPQGIRGGKAFYDFTPRIVYENSRVHENSEEMEFYEGRLNHLWVDIFILDELPAKPLAAAWTKFLHKAIYGMAMGHRYKLDYGKYGLKERILVGGLAAVGKLIPMPFLFWLQKKAALKDKKGKSDLRYYSNYAPDYLYVTLKKEWCEQIVEMEFEGEMLMAPKGFDDILTIVYGNYMKLPPKEKRVPAHSTMEIQVYDDEVAD